MKEYIPVPVSEARRIGEKFKKSMAIIIAYDIEHALTHTTTWGKEPEDKEQAADVGETCTRLICGEGYEQRRSFEDYRFTDQGKRTKEIEDLKKENQKLREKGLAQHKENRKLKERIRWGVKAGYEAGMAEGVADGHGAGSIEEECEKEVEEIIKEALGKE